MNARLSLRAPLTALAACALLFGCSDDSDDGSPSGGAGGDVGGAGGSIGGAGGETGGVGGDVGGAGGEVGGAGGEIGGAGGDVGGAGGGGIEVPPPDPVATTLPPPDSISAAPSMEVPRPGSCDEAYQWVTEIRGWVVDDQGAPVPAAKAQACINLAPDGTLLCLQPGDTAADGSYTIFVNAEARCMEKVSMRVLKPGTGRVTAYDTASFDTVSQAVLQLNEPTVLYQAVPGDAPAEGDPLEARTISFYDGLEIDLVPDRFFASYGDLGVRRLDAEASPGLYFLEGLEAPMGLYGFVPEGDVEGEPFPVRIPNDNALAPGAVVDLYVLGGLSCTLADGTHVPEGEWMQYGEGTVDAEGAFIVSAPADGGLPCLNWMGYLPR